MGRSAHRRQRHVARQRLVVTEQLEPLLKRRRVVDARQTVGHVRGHLVHAQHLQPCNRSREQPRPCPSACSRGCARGRGTLGAESLLDPAASGGRSSSEGCGARKKESLRGSLGVHWSCSTACNTQGCGLACVRLQPGVHRIAGRAVARPARHRVAGLRDPSGHHATAAVGARALGDLGDLGGGGAQEHGGAIGDQQRHRLQGAEGQRRRAVGRVSVRRASLWHASGTRVGAVGQ